MKTTAVVESLSYYKPMYCSREYQFTTRFIQQYEKSTSKNFTDSFWLILMMAAILKSAILDLAILHKKNFTHSIWLNLMMAAILDSATAILDL